MDLFSAENTEQFRSAIRNVTDTFHRTPVTLFRTSGEEIELLAGMIPMETGDDGEVNGEMYARDRGSETVERWIVTFNRDYLAEKGLVDPDEDRLLIGDEDLVIYKGRRFAIVQLTDKAIFRGVPILARLKVAR
jgi:hypothetical protein